MNNVQQTLLRWDAAPVHWCNSTDFVAPEWYYHAHLTLADAASWNPIAIGIAQL